MYQLRKYMLNAANLKALVFNLRDKRSIAQINDERNTTLDFKTAVYYGRCRISEFRALPKLVKFEILSISFFYGTSGMILFSPS